MKRTKPLQIRFTPAEHKMLFNDCEMLGIKASQLMRKSTFEYLKRLKQLKGLI